MASSDPELVRLYLNRLVGSLAPSQLNSTYLQSLVNDLTMHITRPYSAASASAQSPTQLLAQFRKLFITQNRESDWNSFEKIVEALSRATLPEDQTRQLVYLSKLAPGLPNADHSQSTSNPYHQGLSLFPSSPQNLPSSTLNFPALINPYYRTLDELVIIASLRHTLVGRDTTVLSFLEDGQSVEIPNSVNTSYTQLLTDILEPALLYKSLSLFLITHQGNKHSPIITAFFKFVEMYLVQYADQIESIFRTPHSLIALLDQLETSVNCLRLLNYLKTHAIGLNGFDFLHEVYKFSQFGDPDVALIAGKQFNDMAAPYYTYLEHWLIRGELLDENEEFFVAFDKNENHINDIIRYHQKKLPSFLGLDDELFFKMFQIGKTLVYLENYCQELDWVNDFSRRYYQFIFTQHSGLQSMSLNTIQVMVDKQFDEVINFFNLIVHSKHLLFSHILGMKRVMLMESSDFIDAITVQGAAMFGEPALSLTSARLSDLLFTAINVSSIRFLPAEYLKRVDARILNLSHGAIGWDVFTLAYNVPEPPLDALLNYKDQNVQYLRLFNFLWGLKHFQILLRQNFVQFQDYHKSDLRHIKTKVKSFLGTLSRLTNQRVNWLSRALRVVCLVRHRISTLVDAILNFVSFDLIENSFNVHIVRKLFKEYSSRIPELKRGVRSDASRLTIMDETFLRDRNDRSLLAGLEDIEVAQQNTTDLTIDDLTTAHVAYLRSVSDCKLLREDALGRHSGKSFVQQIFELLELAYEFLHTSEEFGTSLSTYVNILRLKTESYDFDEDWDELHRRLNSVKKYIQTDIYADKLQPWLKAFTQDMRAEVDLREFSRMI